MQIVKPENNDGFQLPAPGFHKAAIVEIEDLGILENRFEPGKKRHELKIVFALDGGTTQFAWYTASLHPDSNLYALAEAVFGDVPPTIETNDLLGRSIEIKIRHYESKGKRRSKVVGVTPLRTTAA